MCVRKVSTGLNHGLFKIHEAMGSGAGSARRSAPVCRAAPGSMGLMVTTDGGSGSEGRPWTKRSEWAS